MSKKSQRRGRPLFLNVGSGGHPLPGFVNVDLDPGADVQADVTKGLPYGNNTVDGVFSEHFIEHLTQAQGVAFFREVRRVLVPGGRMRVATPDLDFLVDVFATDWRRNMEEWTKYGYEWIANRAEQLNLVMREWGHRWLYNEEELVRLARVAGLEPLERCRLGESREPRFRGIDYREGSTLIWEFEKRRPAVRDDEPLVSIVMTAYNPRYFEGALASALGQTYRRFEIVIGDDRPTGEIAAIVARHADDRIRHHKNATNLGEKRNLIETFARAEGEYVKFLNDDDVLHPTCVERMVRCLNRHPDVTLVTSHRQVIDADGRPLADLASTRRPVREDSVIDGVSVVRALLESGLNFVGEPSTVMFRRADLADTRPNILSFADREAIGTIDATMWANLLGKGDAIYLVDTLSYFRLHSEQAQRSDDYLKRQAGPAREQLVFDARRMGLLEKTGPLTLALRPLAAASASGDDAAAPVPTAAARPRVSIVIPVWNKIGYTQKCLDALWRNTPAGLYEIVLVDNGSTDGTRSALERRMRPGMKLIVNESNLGFARACNQGAAQAAGDYVLFLNNDTEPEAGWLEPLVRVLDADPEVAAAGSKLLYPDGTIQHAGVIIVEDRTAEAPLVAKHVHHGAPGDTPDIQVMRTYQALTAACLLVRKSAFADAGGFDEDYWNGYEDVDLCFKLQQRGLKLVYQPGSVVVHHESKSGPERWSKVNENVRRLQERWLGNVTPDVIRERDGSTARTDAGFARPYASPAATEESAPLADTVSIVILTWNQLAYTRECVASIQRHTPEAHEIVFVDNGSTDGTLEWLERQVAEHAHYRLIKNATNLGFAKGSNQGIAAARGDSILLLNNDVIVTPHWLQGLLECLKSGRDVGFVGPMTNHISGPQQVPATEDASGAGLDAYAVAFRERHRGRRVPLRRIVGFCMLFARDLVERVGVLDERFGSGNYEDDDWCLRAAILGLRSVVAGDVFVHHHGSRTFLGNKVSFGGAMTGNRRVFAEKWGAVPADSALGVRVHALQTAERAAELHARGETEPAIAAILDGLRRAPTDRDLFDRLVEILLDTQRWAEALDVLAGLPASLDVLVGPRADDDDLVRLVRMGHAHEGLGAIDEADACADRVLVRAPQSAAAMNLKGVVAFKRGDRDAAARWCRAAVEADPGNGDAARNLGVLEWAADRRDAGLDLLERGFVRAPWSADSAEGYHTAITATEQWARACPVFAEAHALRPSDRRVAFFLIDVLVRAGKNAAAMQVIEEALLAFGIDDGILAAALDVRATLGPLYGVTPARKSAAISLCMIVRDEEAHLARCLASIKPIVAEIVVVDTGSTDRSRAIATAFGAHVLDHAWTGDFAAARNVGLAHATGDVILALDADEIVAAHDLEALRSLAGKRGDPPRAWAFVTRNYVVPVYNTGWTANDGSYPREEAGTGWFPSVKARLFPNRSTIRFSDPVHERVEASLVRAGVRVQQAAVPVHHYGKLDERNDRRKGEAYFELGKKKVEELGDDVLAISELAIQARALERYADAVELWERVLKIRADLPIAWFNLGSSLIELGRYDEALTASRRALELAPEQKEIVYNAALAELYAGEPRRAVAALEQLVESEPDYPVAAALLAAAWCPTGRAERGAESFAAQRAQGFAIAGYLAVLTGHLAAAGRDSDAHAVIEAARTAGLEVAAAALATRR